MKHLLSSILLISYSLTSLADDTEIYGAAAIDSDSRINPNIMFIMDTSGSMSGTVKSNPVYDPAFMYAGTYSTSHAYHSLSAGIADGHLLTAFSKGNSTGCMNEVSALSSAGKIQGTFEQLRDDGKWNPVLQNGSSNDIRCDSGNNYWIYHGNYLNWYYNYSEAKDTDRLTTVVDVLRSLTHTVQNVNFGLMRFDEKAHGGMIDVKAEDIKQSAEKIRTVISGYSPNGGTPLTEVMHEAALYFRGETWEYGKISDPNVSTSESLKSDGTTYDSPIEASCQKNHIILLTDGQPSSDGESNAYVRNLIKDMSLPSGLEKDCGGAGDCLDEYAYWLKNTDHSDDFAGSQNITTYTIGGFNLKTGVDLLTRAANFGGGEYYSADNSSGLIKAIDSIILKILSQDTTFTAPAVSVNAFNASEHRDELYYALFRPQDSAKWFGNLKRYRIDQNGFVRDANDNLAVDSGTGFFNDGAKDFWNESDINDGKDVTQGGVANLITPSTRTLYSDADNGTLSSFASLASAETLDMTSAPNSEVIKVKAWVQGFDVGDIDGDSDYTDSRNQIGDPLHSEPVVVTYGGTDEAPDSTIYFGTNEGVIHAINTETGLEDFAFLPTELHKNQKVYFDNTIAAGDRPYGMDGAITSWMYDINNNNVIYDTDGSLDAGEHVYLYAGMRRGGRNYYALNVTNRTSPKLLFKIEGGQGDFVKLGQTWSRMTIAKVKWNGVSRFVAFFAGGYDTNQDSNTTPEEDAMGNAIFMIDASTGERLWWSSNTGADLNITDMKNSIPASVSAVDISGDGHIDYLFAADTGGRVFRIDFNPNNTGASNFAKGGVIASFADSDAAGNRRFYNKPNVSLVKDKQFGDYLTIAIGSGHRAHPVLTQNVENRFYLIKDFHPYSAPSSYSPKTAAATNKTTLAANESPNKNLLYNATSLMTGGESAKTLDMQNLLNNGGGWYVTFSTTGEKVLAESTTFKGAIIFTTFSPTASSSSTASCGVDTGTSRVYTLDQRWGTPVIDLDNDGVADASTELAHSGIAPRPVVIYRKGGGKTIAIGTETLDDERFKESKPKPDPECSGEIDCPEDDDPQPQVCEAGNCYVTPVYWRQNDNE